MPLRANSRNPLGLMQYVMRPLSPAPKAPPVTALHGHGPRADLSDRSGQASFYSHKYTEIQSLTYMLITHTFTHKSYVQTHCQNVNYGVDSSHTYTQA